jgi:hypothetical protein
MACAICSYANGQYSKNKFVGRPSTIRFILPLDESSTPNKARIIKGRRCGKGHCRIVQRCRPSWTFWQAKPGDVDHAGACTAPHPAACPANKTDQLSLTVTSSQHAGLASRNLMIMLRLRALERSVGVRHGKRDPRPQPAQLLTELVSATGGLNQPHPCGIVAVASTRAELAVGPSVRLQRCLERCAWRDRQIGVWTSLCQAAHAAYHAVHPTHAVSQVGGRCTRPWNTSIGAGTLPLCDRGFIQREACERAARPASAEQWLPCPKRPGRLVLTWHMPQLWSQAALSSVAA